MNISLPDVTLDNERLAALIFELASQLHIERAHRIALELQFERGGRLDGGWQSAVNEDPEYRRRCSTALDVAMSKLMRLIAEGDDPRTPLRHEAPGHRSAADGE